MFTVFTVDGREMILENAGKDADGHQLWRQIPVDNKPELSRAEAVANVIERMQHGW